MTKKVNIYKKLGIRINQIRTDRGLTQEKLALEAGLNRAYVGYIERGERNPSIETISKIARVLKIKLFKLFQF